jgi:ABC-2 type transport system permease protein
MVSKSATADFRCASRRTAGKRSQFRRRQTSSRVATFAEAVSPIAWAGAAALAAAGTWIAVVPAIIDVAILAGTRLVRPQAAFA